MWGRFFSSKAHKTPEDVVNTLREHLREIAKWHDVKGDGSAPQNSQHGRLVKANDQVSKAMHALKAVLFGTDDPSGNSSSSSPNSNSNSNSSATNNNSQSQHPQKDQVNMVIQLACDTDLLDVIVDNLGIMQFETRKDAVQIFNNLLRRHPNKSTPTSSQAQLDTAISPTSSSRLIQKVASNDGRLIAQLMRGYEDAAIALNCGQMLRECIRHDVLLSVLFTCHVPLSGVVNGSERGEGGEMGGETGKEKSTGTLLFYQFFRLVEKQDFDIASDAFASFRECLSQRRLAVSARHVERDIDTFETHYNRLLASQNYVTRRQSLKLLGEMLLERATFRIMTHYIRSAANLRIIMNLLLDTRKNIQFEAFHVFKIFVANPKKAADVEAILARNRDKLLNYLEDFLVERDDDQFHDDRKMVQSEISKLRPLPATLTNNSAGTPPTPSDNNAAANGESQPSPQSQQQQHQAQQAIF